MLLVAGVLVEEEKVLLASGVPVEKEMMLLESGILDEVERMVLSSGASVGSWCFGTLSLGWSLTGLGGIGT